MTLIPRVRVTEGVIRNVPLILRFFTRNARL